MQTLIRERGVSTMPADAHQTFLNVHTGGQLVAPEDAGHVTAALALKAPKSLSGQFISWNDDSLKEFRRA